jgi:hypothetical protein
MAMVVAPMLSSPIGGWMFQTYRLANVLLIPLMAGVITLALCIIGLH